MNSFIVFVKSYSILALYVSVHHEKSFLPAFFKGYIDHLFDNLVSGKKIIVLEEGLEKICTNPV